LGAIVDTLFIEEADLRLVKERYPRCVAMNQSDDALLIQRYRVIIPDEDLADDSYYLFLLENGIAMSSNNFLSRVESDRPFAERMSRKIAESMERVQLKNREAG
jgi:hypothetical protein